MAGAGSEEQWRDTIMGGREEISPENEKLWREALEEICTCLMNRASQKLKNMPEIEESLHILWAEEYLVAEAVLRDVVRNGM